MYTMEPLQAWKYFQLASNSWYTCTQVWKYATMNARIAGLADIYIENGKAKQ